MTDRQDLEVIEYDERYVSVNCSIGHLFHLFEIFAAILNYN